MICEVIDIDEILRHSELPASSGYGKDYRK